MKTVITLITLLTAISIGSISYADRKNTNATKQTTLNEHDSTTTYVTVPVRIPVSSSDDTEIDYSFDSDDGC